MLEITPTKVESAYSAPFRQNCDVCSYMLVPALFFSFLVGITLERNEPGADSELWDFK